MLELVITLLLVAAVSAMTIGIWMLIMRLLWPLVRRVDARGLAKETEGDSPPKGQVGSRSEGSGAGLAISLAGAGVMLVGVFLPWAESSSFARIEENTVIQSGYGLYWVVLSVIAVSAVLGSRRTGNGGWIVFGVGIAGVLFAIFSGTGDRLLLESVGSFSGPGSDPTVHASPGIGIYATGIGSGLTAIGGWLLSHDESAVDPNPGTRTCPECKFEVPADATVCGHCRSRLSGGSGVEAS